mmetsp:Transcript_4370/g.7781  ORF Transcript_4370/g.7781 Transcript_4370/m.7781 type:complete len:298 (-) Transcript_4370:53-946(-)|eukprot:CAMPEP_0201984092 /NCGR_PEP_ID=MMETSP0904-20121228/82311_1 /ASSEMBLY_ACC=CAM_ASM_000553 /TAXON_ID=420261 /ORGANISM="Thalassiosira antarctica, Strain CCMP982" /LENGTH=297 /DNA_ID=CAMNT_0048537387 /DNA_START=377 /DNA_END=1270 /DNA_ORIENTATION=-
MRNNTFNESIAAKDSTANDEAIARAIAESEGHSHSNTQNIVSSPPSTTLNCKGQHGLEVFVASDSQCATCNVCHTRLRGGNPVWSCVQCNFDSCESCYRCYHNNIRGTVSAPPQSTSSSHNGTSSIRTLPSPMPNVSPSSQNNNPFAANNATPSSHMCLIPCTIGSITVEMLVDTGAQSSVLSMPLVSQLGLSNRLDRRFQGIAAGVGRARILGSIRNVVCVFGVGHVEFLMDFIVLEVKDPLVIIGLDQLRKYKCLVDVGREKLIFGGAGGVEVEMLPAHQTHFDIRSLNGGCTLM